jgi:DNA modification methylase
MTTITKPARALTSDISAKARARRSKLKTRVELNAIARGPKRNDLLPDLKIEKRAIDSLTQDSRKVRTLTNEHAKDIARSIAKFGQVAPVLITGEGRIIDGVGVAAAMAVLGEKTVSCVVVDHLSDEEARLLRLALNRLQEKGSWNLAELKLEIQDLTTAGLSLVETGFTAPEVDLVLSMEERVVDPKANDCTEPRFEEPAVSRLGDEWLCGPHRVLCADATKPESYARLFQDLPPARASFGDPPWNIPIDGFVAAKGKHKDFLAASGEMTDDEYVGFLTSYLKAMSAHIVDGGVVYLCMDWRHVEHVCETARRAGLSILTLVVWSKGVGGLGGLYRSAHELVFVLKKGNAKVMNNVELGKHGGDRTNVWTYPGANQRGSSANTELANHPTPKPVELVADAIRDVTKRGDVLVDPFLGSGTTLIAAQKMGRVAVGLERDPHFVDLIVRRYEKFTGNKATLAGSHKTFDEVAALRQEASAQEEDAGS